MRFSLAVMGKRSGAHCLRIASLDAQVVGCHSATTTRSFALPFSVKSYCADVVFDFACGLRCQLCRRTLLACFTLPTRNLPHRRQFPALGDAAIEWVCPSSMLLTVIWLMTGKSSLELSFFFLFFWQILLLDLIFIIVGVKCYWLMIGSRDLHEIDWDSRV